MNTTEKPSEKYDYVSTVELEKRKRTRIPDLTSSEVFFSTPTHGEQTGTLEDVSLGGFAVRIAEALGFFAHQELIVSFKEGLIRARVKYVATDVDEGYRIGLEWVQPRSPAVISILERCLTELYAQVAPDSTT